MVNGRCRRSRRQLLSTFGIAAGSALLGIRVSFGADADEKFEEQNGIRVYGKDAKVALPQGYPEANFDVISLYGFRVVEVDGKKKWMAATKDDYVASEMKRTGKKADEVTKHKDAEHPLQGCYQTGPTSCAGICSSGFCNLVYNPSQHYYYCTCT